MKLNESRPNVEVSGDWEEEFFSIKDQGMIFEILRSKMYSNPILAICREVSCNARDAHREVGKPEVPVHIHLPNYLEKYYKIKDFGPGISPDRMVNIFIKYTASTKREDNLQTGGFGLGAKTPFAYSDQFSIVTVHNGIEYNYSCLIDATKVGKLMKGSETPTNKPNGTEIIIPVKDQDFKFFADWTELATRHWKVKPIIKGGTINYTTSKNIIEGNGWAIQSTTDWQRAAKMIIDEIEYPLELDSLKKYADSKLIDSARGSFVMYFGVGELTLSASREQVYLDKPTQDKIRKRMDSIFEEIKGKVVAKIDAFPNLWEANVYYRQELTQAFHSLQFLGTLSWKGIPLTNGYIDVNCPTFNFTKGKYSRRTGNDPNKLTRGRTRALSFSEGSVLYVNDLPLKEPTPRHVKKAFDDNPKLVSLQIICPDGKVSIADLNKKISLDKMQPKLLSSITKASARNYTPATSRLILFKFDSPARNFRQVSYSSVEEDLNTNKVLCLLSRDQNDSNRFIVLENKNRIQPNILFPLSDKFPKFSFYGVDSSTPADRLEEEFSDFMTIDDFLDEKVLNNTKINYVEIKFALSNSYHSDSYLVKHEAAFKKAIKDKNSLFLRRLDLSRRIRDLSGSDTALLEIYESVNGAISEKIQKDFKTNNPDWDIEKINKECIAQYPLLTAIRSYDYAPHVESIAQYVNMIDKI